MAQAIGLAGVGARVLSPPAARRHRYGPRWLEAAFTVSLAALVLVGALFYVWQHTRVVRLGYEIERLRQVKAGLVQENKSLRLALGQLRALKRVEEAARTRLGMVTPAPGQVILVPESPIQ